MKNSRNFFNISTPGKTKAKAKAKATATTKAKAKAKAKAKRRQFWNQRLLKLHLPHNDLS